MKTRHTGVVQSLTHILPLSFCPSEVSTNVVTVGSEGRAAILASLLDQQSDGRTVTAKRSPRGFVTYNGTFSGIPVSVIMINMGYPNMDFLVREVRAVTEGPLRIVRLGSCAGLRDDLPVGTVAVASHGSTFVAQNPDAWNPEDQSHGDDERRLGREVTPYTIHRVVQSHAGLSQCVLAALQHCLGESGPSAVVGCLNASADSFYSSQGESSQD